ncbi:MAG: gliding motility-associated C-terminal domain-containing protein [Bacteroidetes bacterium]|nr:gliding motility-associated C-terminal domain-containing protein [Bacteroidota bacterium]
MKHRTTTFGNILWFLLTIFPFLNIYGQQPTSGDCFGAFTVCALNYNQELSFTGEGNYQNEINGATSCLNSGESNNSWYIITVQTPGTFGFNITPNCDNADYDWAVFDLTNSNCSDIATDPTIEVACDFSGSTFPTSVTGMNGGANPQDEPMINVNAGDVYALVVNNFSGLNQCGYILDFSISSAGIIDLSPPEFNAVTSQVLCGANAITFTYSEFVRCNTVHADEFLMIGPTGDTLNITSVIGLACINGGLYEKEFTITIDELLFEGGTYTIKGFGQVEDNCGNFNSDTLELFFNINSVSVDAVMQSAADCRLNNGRAEAQVAGGTAPFTFNWQPANQSSAIAQNLPFGWQEVTVIDGQGCRARDSVFIEDVNSFEAEILTIPDTCSFGLGSAIAIVTGGQPFVDRPGQQPYNYFWNVTDQQNDTTFVDSLLTGPYTMSVRDSFGCVYNLDFIIPDYRFNLIPDFVFSPDTNPIPGLLPTVSFINQSLNATEFIWDFDSGDFSTEYEPDYIFPGSGTYDVQLIAMNSFGCMDSISKPVTIDFFLNYFAPNAFTPNNDLVNDSFNIVLTGIMDSTYRMIIFDRWGGEVFVSTDVKEAWSGRINNNGNICPSGTYVFRASFIDLSGKKHVIYGKILLIG